jgi:uncharacterized protein YeeX (DUF496 family)
LEITVVRQLLEPKTEPVKKRKVTIKAEKLNDYFADDVSEEEITEIIMELLEDWKRRTGVERSETVGIRSDDITFDATASNVLPQKRRQE